MCGIVGFTQKDSVLPAGLVDRAVRSLHHRGPDQNGTFQSALVALGAVRLKVIDLAGGRQPMVSDDGATALVFNGEVYNHAELRRELESLGHRFHTHGDTEVVLRAFLQWDADAFPRLRGMFAFALWNEPRRRLVLCRDRMGVKPLYIHRRDRDLYFGSELKALFAHPGVERRLDRDALGLYLSLNYVPGERTLVEGVRKLAPGHWLEWRDGEIRTEPYWRLEMRPRPRPLRDAAEELDALLKSAVREHMVSDVPLGIWASGGLDSSTILHYAAEALSTPLKTFSIAFPGRSFDESDYFRTVAEHYGTDHHEFDLGPDLDLAGAVEQFATYSDEPSADAGALPVWFLSRMSRQHVTVALSGEGADELFGGYQTYVANRYARRFRLVPAALRRWMASSLSAWPSSDEKISFGYKLRRFVDGSLLPADEAHSYWNGTFSRAEQRALLREPAGLRLAEFHRGLSRGPVNRYLQFDQLHYLPDDILHKCDRMSMAHSLEVRPPFLDHRIVEFAASLPESLKIQGGRLKRVLRETMRHKLPPAVLRRRKEGLDIPSHDWLRTTLRPLLLDTLSPEAVEATGLFRARAIDRLIDAHLNRRADVGYHLWGLLILFLWIRRWRIECEPVAEMAEQLAGVAHG